MGYSTSFCKYSICKLCLSSYMKFNFLLIFFIAVDLHVVIFTTIFFCRILFILLPCVLFRHILMIACAFQIVKTLYFVVYQFTCYLLRPLFEFKVLAYSCGAFICFLIEIIFIINNNFLWFLMYAHFFTGSVKRHMVGNGIMKFSTEIAYVLYR